MSKEEVLELAWEHKERLWKQFEEALAAHKRTPRRHRADRRLAREARRQTLIAWSAADKLYYQTMDAFGQIEQAKRVLCGPR